ncbi:CHAT domain-containing protein [Aquimarina sp. D1M17]|uniref:CHAT domain-containing protein n=1 Tax=Aquimarina acroporae TaxID=2937283 RepID=UPI0020BFC36B|nr:CHAT domain-containing tetratricopeptide repeat protein [Aquimarina acroporae]MCK8520888.1 CHAT domain-containing protein [Aquimarina acroporae]
MTLPRPPMLVKTIWFLIFIISFSRGEAQVEQDSVLESQYLNKTQFRLSKKELGTSLTYLKNALDFELQRIDQDQEKILIYYAQIGFVYRNLNEYEIALDYFRIFLKLAIQRYGKNHLYTGYGFLNLGVTYKNLLRHEMALRAYNKSLIVFQYCKKADMVAFVYNSIGDILAKKGEFSNAIDLYERSIHIIAKLFGKNYVENGKNYKNIGALYYLKEDYEKALLFYKKSLNILIDVYGENRLDVADLCLDIGNIYNDKKEYDSALKYYHKTLNGYMNVLSKDDQKIVDLNLLIIDVQVKKKKLNEFNKTISYFDKAIVSNKKPYSKDNRDTFTPSEYYDSKLLLKILHGKAKVLQERFIKDKNIRDLNSSLKIYEQADILIDYIRKSYQSHKDKMAFAKNARKVYADAVDAEFLLYKEAKTQQTPQKIIYYVEKSKGNTLKDLINEAKTKEFSGLSDNLLEMDRIQRINRAFYQSRIIEESSNIDIDQSKIQEYEKKIANIDRIEDSLSNIFKDKHPKYYRLKFQNSVILVDEIQKMLNKETDLLEFFTSESTTYVFAITKDKIEIKALNILNIPKKITQFRRAIANKHTKAYKTIAHQLYQDLISPIAPLLKGRELIIVPDGSLWHLNFDLLLYQKDISNNPKELSYLLKKHIVSYANSANLLFSDRNESIFDFLHVQKECLAFSFSSNASFQSPNSIKTHAISSKESDLPGTRREIKSISKIMEGQYFFGDQAIEANFKKNASNYNVLHLAMHGKVDHENPENSKLLFTKSENSEEDNNLYSHELFGLNIPAELAVLSACNTGSGKIAKGEGIMSLGHAFQYAGTKSLLLSSWEVSDETTPEIMKYFYTYLKQGMKKNEALQKAKLTYLNYADADRTHPFYWGSFYLIGETTPMHFDNHKWLYWITSICILSIILFLSFKTKILKYRRLIPYISITEHT